jgi:lipoyl(octanoyl) transferase
MSTPFHSEGIWFGVLFSMPFEMIQNETTCLIKDLGLIGYTEAYQLQRTCVDDLLQGGPQRLLLCEHPPVLTLGRLAKTENILIDKTELARRAIEIHAIDRGGDITLHAPGQLVIYPILNLSPLGRDLRRYLYHLEQVAIDLLGGFDIVASRLSGQTGVWTGKNKIASIGIGVRKWVSFHGLSINVNTDLTLFSMIRPCGLNVPMTSIERIKGKRVDMAKVKQEIVRCFQKNFPLEFLSGV